MPGPVQSGAKQRVFGDRSYYAASLMSIGRLRRQKGDSDGARKIYEEALAVCRQPGEKGEVAAVQVALGGLACDIGQTAEAQTLARLAIEEFRAEREPDPEIQSEALLSWSLLQQGKLDDAEAAMLPCCLFCCACFFRDKLETLLERAVLSVSSSPFATQVRTPH